MAKNATSKPSHGKRARALVTGASSGIGAAFAVRLARDQHDVILVARNRSRLEEQAQRLRKEHGVDIEVLAADLTELAELRVVEKVAEDAQLDRLINNAGFGTSGSFAKLDANREEEEIRLNVLALVRLTRVVLPGMLARNRGGIINVSSMAALQAAPFN